MGRKYSEESGYILKNSRWRKISKFPDSNSGSGSIDEVRADVYDHQHDNLQEFSEHLDSILDSFRALQTDPTLTKKDYDNAHGDLCDTLADYLEETPLGLLEIKNLDHEKRKLVEGAITLLASQGGDKRAMSALQSSVDAILDEYDIPVSYTIDGDTEAIRDELDIYRGERNESMIRKYNTMFDRELIPVIEYKTVSLSYDNDGDPTVDKHAFNNDKSLIFSQIVDMFSPTRYHKLELEQDREISLLAQVIDINEVSRKAMSSQGEGEYSDSNEAFFYFLKRDVNNIDRSEVYLYKKVLGDSLDDLPKNSLSAIDYESDITQSFIKDSSIGFSSAPGEIPSPNNLHERYAHEEISGKNHALVNENIIDPLNVDRGVPFDEEVSRVMNGGKTLSSNNDFKQVNKAFKEMHLVEDVRDAISNSLEGVDVDNFNNSHERTVESINSKYSKAMDMVKKINESFTDIRDAWENFGLFKDGIMKFINTLK